MPSQKSKNLKAQKARVRRKDFLKKRNIRKNNEPTPRYKVETPILKAEKDKQGKMKYSENGSRIEIKKSSKQLLTPGDGKLPKSRKYKEGKKAKKEKKQLAINANAGKTATGKI